MTAAEKKRMLQLVRAVESLYSENAALQVALAANRIPKSRWEPLTQKLMSDPKTAPVIRAKFQHLYDEIENSRDESEAFEELLKILPPLKKDWN